MRKRISLTIIGILLTVSSVMAGVTIKMVYNNTVSDTAIVGETVLYDNGLVITLIEKSLYTLTYEAIDETDVMKHEITYVYSYEFIDAEMDINVSSLSSDIEVTDLVSDDSTIWITFKLNQDVTFSDGQVLNIQFYFEGIPVEVSTGLDINIATVEELMALGFSEREATDIEGYGGIFTDLDNVHYIVYVENIHERFDELINNGIIVFN